MPRTRRALPLELAHSLARLVELLRPCLSQMRAAAAGPPPAFDSKADENKEPRKRAKRAFLYWLQDHANLVTVHGWHTIEKRQAFEPMKREPGQKQQHYRIDQKPSGPESGGVDSERWPRLQAWTAGEEVAQMDWRLWPAKESLPKYAHAPGSDGLEQFGPVEAKYIEAVKAANRHQHSFRSLLKSAREWYTKMVGAVGPDNEHVKFVLEQLERLETLAEDESTSHAREKKGLAGATEKGRVLYEQPPELRLAEFVVDMTREYHKGVVGGGTERAPITGPSERDDDAETVATAVRQMLRLATAKGDIAARYLSAVARIVVTIQQLADSARGNSEVAPSGHVDLLGRDESELGPDTVLQTLYDADQQSYRQPYVAWGLLRGEPAYEAQWRQVWDLVQQWNKIPILLRGGSMVTKAEAACYGHPSVCDPDESGQLPKFIPFELAGDLQRGMIYVVTDADQQQRTALRAQLAMDKIGIEEHDRIMEGPVLRTPVPAIACGRANVLLDDEAFPLLRQPDPQMRKVKKVTMHMRHSDMIYQRAFNTLISRGEPTIDFGDEGGRARWASLMKEAERKHATEGRALSVVQTDEVRTYVQESESMKEAARMAGQREEELRAYLRHLHAEKAKLDDQVFRMSARRATGSVQFDPEAIMRGPATVPREEPLYVDLPQYREDSSQFAATNLDRKLRSVEAKIQAMRAELEVLSSSPALDPDTYNSDARETTFVAHYTVPFLPSAYDNTNLWLENKDSEIAGARNPRAVRWACFYFDHFLRTYYWWETDSPALSTIQNPRKRNAKLRQYVEWAKTLRENRRTWPQLPIGMTLGVDEPPEEGSHNAAVSNYPIGAVTCGPTTLVLGPSPSGAIPDGLNRTTDRGGVSFNLVYLHYSEPVQAASRMQRRLEKSIVSTVLNEGRRKQMETRLLAGVNEGTRSVESYRQVMDQVLFQWITAIPPPGRPSWTSPSSSREPDFREAAKHATDTFLMNRAEYDDAFLVEAAYVSTDDEYDVGHLITLEQMPLGRFLNSNQFNQAVFQLVQTAEEAAKAPVGAPMVQGQLVATFKTTGAKRVFSNLPPGVQPDPQDVVALPPLRPPVRYGQAGPSDAMVDESHLDPGPLRLPALGPLL